MNYFLRILTSISIFALIIFISCKKDDDTPPPVPSAGETASAQLSGTWEIESVDFGGETRTATWGDAFTITFSSAAEGSNAIWGGNYATGDIGDDELVDDNGRKVWPASGTWEYASAELVNSFTRSDGVTVTISSISDSALTLTLVLTESSGRSVDIYDEQWTFTFTK